MAISLRLIAKAYRPAIRILIRHLTPRHHFAEKRAQRRERGCRRLRGGHGAHRRAGRGVQHHERNFLDRAGRSIVELASRHDPGIAVDDFVHVDRSLEPGMPRVRHHRLVPAAPGTTRPMSVLS